MRFLCVVFDRSFIVYILWLLFNCVSMNFYAWTLVGNDEMKIINQWNYFHVIGITRPNISDIFPPSEWQNLNHSVISKTRNHTHDLKNIHSAFWYKRKLTHWGRVTHTCVVKQTIIGSDNGLSPGRRQAIIWTNAGILLFGPLGTNFSEILIGIQLF